MTDVSQPLTAGRVGGPTSSQVAADKTTMLCKPAVSYSPHNWRSCSVEKNADERGRLRPLRYAGAVQPRARGLSQRTPSDERARRRRRLPRAILRVVDGPVSR